MYSVQMYRIAGWWAVCARRTGAWTSSYLSADLDGLLWLKEQYIDATESLMRAMKLLGSIRPAPL